MSNPQPTAGSGSRDDGRAIERRLREMNDALLVSSVRQHELTERALKAETAAAYAVAIVDGSDDAIVGKDLDGIVTSWNCGAERLFGYSAAEIIGRPIALLFPVDHVPVESAFVERLRSRGSTENQETIYRRKDGTVVEISTRISPLRDADGAVVGSSMIARDIAERKRAERLLDAQRDVLTLATRGGVGAEIFELVVRSARRHCGDHARASLFLLEPDGRRLRFAANAGLPPEYIAAVDGFAVGPNSPSCGQAAFTGLPCIVPDVRTDPLWTPFLDLAERHGIRSLWTQPLRTLGGEVMGTMAIYYRTVHEPDADERNAIRLLSQTTALVIERNREAERRLKAECSLRGSEVRYRRLFEASKDGALILGDADGRIIDANPAVCSLLGLEHAEAIGRTPAEIGLFPDEASGDAAMKELREHGSVRRDRLSIELRDGRRVDLELVANSYRADDAGVIQCIYRDVTERTKLETRLKDQAAELTNLHRRKDEFLAMLSHELRSPLAPIANAVRVLGMHPEGEDPIRREARGVIERQTLQLQSLVDDLLDVSRITTGRVRLRLKSVDVGDLVRRAAEAVRPLVAQHAHELRLNVPEHPVLLFADAVRMEQVLVNLLTNAVKYTDAGGRISVTVDETVEECVIRVRDNGVGIPPAVLPGIFELFNQSERTLDRADGGLGIGLSLVRKLVELHGGRVEASSVFGQGSEFVIRLPSASLAPAKPVPAEVPAARSAARPRRVLVVDDNEDTAWSFAMLLRAFGHEVRTAHDGPSGLEAALDERPDVVFLDIGLPGLDGYEVARRLRRRPELAAAVLVAVTGYGQDDDLRHSREAGFDHHLVKPARLEEVQAILSSAAGRAPSE